MSAFDSFQELGESGIIIVDLGWINIRGGLCVVAAGVLDVMNMNVIQRA